MAYSGIGVFGSPLSIPLLWPKTNEVGQTACTYNFIYSGV